jgi:outer membrane protein TolC
MLIFCRHEWSTSSGTGAGPDAKTCGSGTAVTTDAARRTGSRPEELYAVPGRAHDGGACGGRPDTGSRRVASGRNLQQFGELHTGHGGGRTGQQRRHARFRGQQRGHEYVSQADVHEAVDLVAIQTYRRASAAAAVARAQADIAQRGLVVTVVRNHYSVAAAQEKLEIAQKTAEEGTAFLKTTQDLERGGEVAHSDVIKAELQMRDRRRQLQESELALLNARLDLAVLLFPDFNDRFELQDNLHATVPIPTLEEVRRQAASNNPDLKAALEAVREAGDEVAAARAAYLPALSLDYFYGIDATHFAVNSVADGQKFSNLGSSIVGTLNIPVWSWGTTQSRVKQSELRRTQAKRELSLAQRKVLADVQSLYSEADMALQELNGLRRSAELSRDSLQLTTLRYKEGEAKVLDVVDAQTTFYSANSAYQDGAVRYWAALAGLQTLTGVWRIP